MHCIFGLLHVMPTDNTMTRLVIHIGEHGHNVQQGTSRDAIEKVKKLVSTILKIEKEGPRKIQMLVARQMIFQSFTKEDVKVTGDKQLNNFLEKLLALVQNKGYVRASKVYYHKKFFIRTMK